MIVRATIDRRRYTFEDGATLPDGRPCVNVRTNSHMLGYFATERFGERLGRAWVREFAQTYGVSKTVTF